MFYGSELLYRRKDVEESTYSGFVYSVTEVYLIAKWTTACFGPYWPPSGFLKRTGLGSHYRHCARTRDVESPACGGFFIYNEHLQYSGRTSYIQ